MLPADLNLPLCPRKQNTRHLSAYLVPRHNRAVRIFISKHLVVPTVRRNNFHRPAFIDPHRPLGGIEHMRPPVGHLSAGIIAIRHPPPGRNLRRVRPPRSRPEPHIPVKPLRLRLSRRITRPQRRPADVDRYGFHLADIPVANQLAGKPKLIPRTLLRTRLEYPPISFDRIGHLSGLPDSKRERLLAVNIHTRLDRGYRRQHMPVVRRGYQYRVDVPPGRKLPKIIIARAVIIAVILVDNIARSILIVGIHIADRHKLHLRLAQKTAPLHPDSPADVPRPLPPDADSAHYNPVARRNGPSQTQRR